MLGIHQAMTTNASDLFFNAKSLDAKTFQVFFRNNRNLRTRTWSSYDIDYFNIHCLQSGITRFVIHAPYAMNPCVALEDKRQTYINLIKEDLLFLQQLAGKKFYVLHPGSATIGTYQEALYNLMRTYYEIKPFAGNTTICLENMSGAGNQILFTIEQIQWCIDNITDVKFCLDTCHAFASGMDIKETLESFIDYIDVLHINGSCNGFGSRKDRHSNLDKGFIPLEKQLEVFRMWERLKPDYPAILETPSDNILNDFTLLKENLK